MLSVSEEGSATQTTGHIREDLQSRYHFMTEIFHITLRAMNVGFFPALSQNKKLQQWVAKTCNSELGYVILWGVGGA